MRQSKGFTIIELMIVVAIVAFLAAVSVPQYFKYLAKARQAEVMMNLASLHTAQQAYFAEHGHYTDVLWGENGLGWRPEGYKEGAEQQNFYYTYGFGGEEGKNYFVGKLKAPADQLNGAYAQNDKFVAKAAGDVAGKGKIDIWYVDEARSMVNDQKGVE